MSPERPLAQPDDDRPADPSGASRRQVLRWMAGVGAAAGVAGVVGWRALDGGGSSTASPSTTLAPGTTLPGIPSHRTLVLIELGGGNDPLSTTVPYEDGRYLGARPTLALGADEVVDIGDGWGVNRRLGPTWERGLAVVSGVGTSRVDLSHFEMLDRWYRGTPWGLDPVPGGGVAPGFLGRLGGALQQGDELVGVSMQFGEAPIVRADGVQTVGLGDVQRNPLIDPEIGERVRQRVALLAAGARSGPTEQARQELAPVAGLLEVLQALPEPTPGVTYPETEIGLQLGAVARILRAPSGVRVLHVPQTVSGYDTHGDHREEHGRLFTELGEALEVFQDDLAANGMTDRVLIATVSEFGRRVEEASGGLDHGAASCMLLAGPVHAGLHGELPDLGALDELGNLRPSIEFDRYYATLASWFDVDPEAVLGAGPDGSVPTPLDGLLRT